MGRVSILARAMAMDADRLRVSRGRRAGGRRDDPGRTLVSSCDGISLNGLPSRLATLDRTAEELSNLSDLSDNLAVMARMTATEVSRKFSAALNRVLAGEEIEIVRNGATVARLTPPARDRLLSP